MTGTGVSGVIVGDIRNNITDYTITYNVDGVTTTENYNIESTGRLPSKSKTGFFI